MNTASSPARRSVHPGAWWVWALAMATAASRTTNPLLLGLVLAVVANVVVQRRTDAPWAHGFRSYLILAAVVIGVRVVFRALLGGGAGGTTILFTLPEVPLPDAAAGIRLGGPVSLEGLIAAVYDGLRLGTLLVCVGAANVLASPRRLLKSLPGALYDVGTAVVVGLSVAPQLVESGQRVRRARALRGHRVRGPRDVIAVVVPVLEDAVERSMALAASMDSRGYGRVGDADPLRRRRSAVLVVGGLALVSMGVYGVLDGTTPSWMGVPLLVAGSIGLAGGLALGGAVSTRTVHRGDPWAAAEWLAVFSGLAAAGVVIATSVGDGLVLNPSITRLGWPTLPPLAAVGVLIGVLPAVITPAPPRGRGNGRPMVRQADARGVGSGDAEVEALATRVAEVAR